MKRRIFMIGFFLSACAYLLFTKLGAKKPPVEPFRLINSVQNRLFPSSDIHPGADTFGATDYLAQAISDRSFPPDDIITLFEGVVRLDKSYPDFLSLEPDAQENALQKFAKTNHGLAWINLLLYYTIEALLSDPIYGGNKDEIGWKWLSHQAGIPRPKTPYAGSQA